MICPLCGVSIPRSGFCSFKLPLAPRYISFERSFNPSVGILFIQACIVSIFFLLVILFQSLGRDSVHSSLQEYEPGVGAKRVSIPRSGFCSFKRADDASRLFLAFGFNPSVGILFIQALSLHCQANGQANVSIPRSGFCSFKPRRESTGGRRMLRFNPSVGILFIQAVMFNEMKRGYRCFNPSVGILFIQAERTLSRHLPRPAVSIPRSGFCSFKPSTATSTAVT